MDRMTNFNVETKYNVFISYCITICTEHTYVHVNEEPHVDLIILDRYLSSR